jgi:hypothetical protein
MEALVASALDASVPAPILDGARDESAPFSSLRNRAARFFSELNRDSDSFSRIEKTEASRVIKSEFSQRTRDGPESPAVVAAEAPAIQEEPTRDSALIRRPFKV